MSRGELKQMIFMVAVALFLIGLFFGLGTTVTITSGWFVFIAIVILFLTFLLLFYGGFLSGSGRYATEENLDVELSYQITQVVTMKNGDNLLFLKEDDENKIQVLHVRGGGFKNFDILELKFIVPKNSGFKVVNGRLWKPAL